MDNSLIGLRTTGDWTAGDLAALPREASRIYNAFLSNDLHGRRT